MYMTLSAQWTCGQRVFGNEIISDGVYDIVKIMLDDMRIRHPEFPAYSYGGLMARLQKEFNQVSVCLAFHPPPSSRSAADAGTSASP